jgi:anti-sigma regulatory factor (Ser/Thr protein kinase)
VKADGQIVIAHDISELHAARNELRLLLESRSLPADVTYDLLTCVQEACKNALRFAGSPRGVHASIAIGNREIVATVRDFGTGLDVGSWNAAPPDLYTESGRGLFLMAELMDRGEFRVDHGTQVRLHRLLPVAPAHQGRAAWNRGRAA